MRHTEQNSTRFTKVGNPQNFFFCPFTFICLCFSIWFRFASSGPKSSLVWFVFGLVGVKAHCWCFSNILNSCEATVATVLRIEPHCLLGTDQKIPNYRELSQTGGIHNLVYLFFD